MSVQITTAFVQHYRANVEFLLQQKGSKLRPFVRVEPQNAEFDFYDRIGATTAQEITTRHSDTPLVSTPHDRRRVALRDFDWADLVDRPDKLRTLIDPTSPYAMNAMWALGRSMDDVIIEMAFGSAWSGKTGATEVTFPAGQTIAVDYVETGADTDGNLTIGKLRRARELFLAAEIDEDAELFMAVGSNQIHALLAETVVGSSDYNSVKPLVDGKVSRFMGFKFIPIERLTKVGDDRSVIAWERSGLLLAVADEITADIGPRRDKRNATQVYVSGSFNSTRMEELRVLEILCDETVFPS